MNVGVVAIGSLLDPCPSFEIAVRKLRLTNQVLPLFTLPPAAAVTHLGLGVDGKDAFHANFDTSLSDPLSLEAHRVVF